MRLGLTGAKMKSFDLANGMTVPAIGQGTWMLGDDPARRVGEIEALRTGIAAGATLIDTAEMYGDGRSESLVGEAIRELPDGVTRGDLFLVSKVLPGNAVRDRIFSSCGASLRRLGVNYLDLYLLHWRGAVPLAETVACMEELVAQGTIRAWGVSNFDIDDMEELWAVPGGRNCQVNQVLYHAGSRGIEFSLLPWMRDHKVTLMSYCPLAQAGRIRSGLLEEPALRRIAAKHGVTPVQVLLAWNIRDGHTIATPRTGNVAHARENAAVANLELDTDDLAALDAAFPPPEWKMPLDME